MHRSSCTMPSLMVAVLLASGSASNLRDGAVPHTRFWGGIAIAKALDWAAVSRFRGGGEAGEIEGGSVAGTLPPADWIGPAASPRIFTGIRERLSSGMAPLAVMATPHVQTRPVKYIYIVSDSTGFTASHALTSCLTQFEGLLVDWHADNDNAEEPQDEAGLVEVRTQMFSNVNESGRLARILQLAAKMNAFIIYTLVNPKLNELLHEKRQELGLQCQDLLGGLVHTVSDYLNMKPSGQPRSSTQERRKPLSDKYFRRIEAVEFTIKHDDGNLPENFYNADVVLLGVSRTGKTPLSTYLAQQFGYKMGNVPIIKDMPLPQSIADVDPRKVFGLTMSPAYLKRIRSRRLAATGVDTRTIGKKEGSAEYDSLLFIAAEVAWGQKLYNQHPQWSVLDVTGRSVEENSAIITELLGRPGKATPVEEALAKSRANFFLSVVKNAETGVTPAGLPPVMVSDSLLAGARCARKDVSTLEDNHNLAARLFSLSADSAEVESVHEAITRGHCGTWHLRARLGADEVPCIARASPLFDNSGAVVYVMCTIYGCHQEMSESKSKIQVDKTDAFPSGMCADGGDGIKVSGNDADAKMSDPSSPPDLGYVEDGDAFLKQVVDVKARMFAESDCVAARISEFVIDAKGPEYTILLVSEAFAKSVGRSAAELVGAPLASLFGQGTDKYTVDAVRASFERGDPISTAFIMYDKSHVGTWRHVYFEPIYEGDAFQPKLFAGVQLL